MIRDCVCACIPLIILLLTAVAKICIDKLIDTLRGGRK